MVSQDEQGSVTWLHRADGSEVEAVEYDPYGKRMVFPAAGGSQARSTVGLDVSYTGHRIDHETGLIYARNRYLHTGWGRFVTVDPLGAWADGANLGNGYGYVGNAPIVASDPLGLLRMFRDGAASGGLGVGANGALDLGPDTGTDSSGLIYSPAGGEGLGVGAGQAGSAPVRAGSSCQRAGPGRGGICVPRPGDGTVQAHRYDEFVAAIVAALATLCPCISPCVTTSDSGIEIALFNHDIVPEQCGCWRRHKVGCQIARFILTSMRTINIYQVVGDKANKYKGTDGRSGSAMGIQWNLESRDPESPHVPPGEDRPPEIGLGHEFIHIMLTQDGYDDSRRIEDEQNVIATENLLRAELGVRQRTHFTLGVVMRYPIDGRVPKYDGIPSPCDGQAHEGPVTPRGGVR
jgi:RHS repeat-associated protein